MFIKILIWSVAPTQVVIAVDKSESSAVRETINNLYGNDIKNVGTALDYITNVLSSTDKMSGFKELVDVMKENDHLYTGEILQLTYKLKKFVNETKNDSDEEITQ